MDYTVCLKQIAILRKEYNIIFEIITYNPSIYAMDHPALTVSNFREKYIGLQKVKWIIPYIYIYTISVELSNLQFKISLLKLFSVSEGCATDENGSADPGEMSPYAAFHLSHHSLPKYLLKGLTLKAPNQDCSR